SSTITEGSIDSLYNPYIEDNLALSFQMQVVAEELYPGFTRRIYLKSYRYNLHLMPKAMLIEAGAQTNSLEEMYNAMEVLAEILSEVLDL
ncbi:MAG: stage II sporulation protein P, partial [Eubacteriales bacterium]